MTLDHLTCLCNLHIYLETDGSFLLKKNTDTFKSLQFKMYWENAVPKVVQIFIVLLISTDQHIIKKLLSRKKKIVKNFFFPKVFCLTVLGRITLLALNPPKTS